MLNPTWREISKETDIQYEGCMSVPSIRGKVERYKDIELTYYNENGEQIMKQIHGFLQGQFNMSVNIQMEQYFQRE